MLGVDEKIAVEDACRVEHDLSRKPMPQLKSILLNTNNKNPPFKRVDFFYGKTLR